jgi:Putative DNA-binding domain
VQPGLGELQHLLYRLITATSGVEEGLAAETNLPPQGITALVRGDARVSAIDRVGIYATMYFYRLLDAIKEDFPATLRVVGEANFHNLIAGYLIEYPPSDPSITEASRHLAEFARNSSVLEKWPFIADLVRLERAILEVFLGPDARPLAAEAMRVIPAAQWPSLRITVHPALELINSEWRVDEILRATESGHLLPEPRHERRTILVWRNDYSVNYRPLDDLERSALSMIRIGYPLGAVCEAVAIHGGDSATPAEMSRMLMRWLTDGLLVRAGQR